MKNSIKIIDPLKDTRIGVATTYGKPYFKFIRSLKKLDVKFDTIFPSNRSVAIQVNIKDLERTPIKVTVETF